MTFVMALVIEAAKFLCPRCRAGFSDCKIIDGSLRQRSVSMPSMSGGV